MSITDVTFIMALTGLLVSVYTLAKVSHIVAHLRTGSVEREAAKVTTDQYSGVEDRASRAITAAQHAVPLEIVTPRSFAPQLSNPPRPRGGFGSKS